MSAARKIGYVLHLFFANCLNAQNALYFWRSIWEIQVRSGGIRARGRVLEYHHFRKFPTPGVGQAVNN